MEDKNPWNGNGKPSFHILNLSNVQKQHNIHFSKHLDTATGPPLPPPNNVGMKKHFQDRVKSTGVHKLQHCFGERGKGGKIKADGVNCPKNFVPHCSPQGYQERKFITKPAHRVGKMRRMIFCYQLHFAGVMMYMTSIPAYGYSNEEKQVNFMLTYLLQKEVRRCFFQGRATGFIHNVFFFASKQMCNVT